MGASAFIPAPDTRVKQAMSLSEMSTRDMATFYWSFATMAARDNKNNDKSSSSSRSNSILSDHNADIRAAAAASATDGDNSHSNNNCSSKITPLKISMTQFYTAISEPKTKYIDAIFSLLDINPPNNNNDHHLTFGEFLHAVTSFCLFEKDEIIKFCFYVFDADKNGYVATNELDNMLKLFHEVDDNENLKGNQMMARRKIDVMMKDMPDVGGGIQMEYDEMKRLVDLFPDLFYPAFRIQNKLMDRYMGIEWWDERKRQLNETKMKRASKTNVVRLTNDQLERMRQRRIRREMGVCKYYVCPWMRRGYDEVYPRKEMRVKPRLTMEEIKYLERQKEKQSRHLRDIKEKNPETSEWKTYLENKKKKEKISQSISTTRERESRRRDRRRKTTTTANKNGESIFV